MRRGIDRDALNVVPHRHRAGGARDHAVCRSIDDGDGVAVGIARVDAVQPRVDGQSRVNGDADRDRSTDNLIGVGVDDRECLVDGVGHVEAVRRGIDGQRGGIGADRDGRDDRVCRAVDDRYRVVTEVADVDAIRLHHDKEWGRADRNGPSSQRVSTLVGQRHEQKHGNEGREKRPCGSRAPCDVYLSEERPRTPDDGHGTFFEHQSCT